MAHNNFNYRRGMSSGHGKHWAQFNVRDVGDNGILGHRLT